MKAPTNLDLTTALEGIRASIKSVEGLPTEVAPVGIRYHRKSLRPQLGIRESCEIWDSIQAAKYNRANAAPSCKLFRDARASGNPVELFFAILVTSPYARHLDKDPFFRKTIADALARNDHPFFIRLGKVLSTRSTPPPAKGFTPLQRLLIDHWIETDPDSPSLCFFSDTALADLVSLVLGSESEFDYDAVTKARQRLNLKKSKRILIHTVRQEGDTILAK